MNEELLMTEAMGYEVVKLYFNSQNWVVSYQGDESLQYSDYSDALISLGILAKELVKIVRHTLRILIFDENSQISKESFLFPSLYEENRSRKVKKSLEPKYL